MVIFYETSIPGIHEYSSSEESGFLVERKIETIFIERRKEGHRQKFYTSQVDSPRRPND